MKGIRACGDVSQRMDRSSEPTSGHFYPPATLKAGSGCEVAGSGHPEVGRGRCGRCPRQPGRRTGQLRACELSDVSVGPTRLWHPGVCCPGLSSASCDRAAPLPHEQFFRGGAFAARRNAENCCEWLQQRRISCMLYCCNAIVESLVSISLALLILATDCSQQRKENKDAHPPECSEIVPGPCPVSTV